MPFDGDLQPHEAGWTIKVEPSPVIAKMWGDWSQDRRNAYHACAADLAYLAITAIQNDVLRTHRKKMLWLPAGIVSYLFRRLRLEHNTILITIFEIYSHGPDCDPPKPGAQAPRPLDPLVLNVSGSGNRYSVDYVEGVLPLPPNKSRNIRFSIICPTYEVRTSAHEAIDVAGYCFLQPLRVVDNSIYYNDHLRLLAVAGGSSLKHAPWETQRLFRRDSALSIGPTASPIGIAFGGIERHAQSSMKNIYITTMVIGTTDARYCLSSPYIASRNSQAICTQLP